MSGVFLSYSRADKASAALLIRGLRGLGVDVWWDEDMPGVDWQEELARQINELSAVVVLWTPNSIESKNVKDEARLGQHKDKLVNALIGVTAPPFPFERTNGLPLDGWTGREKHNGWSRLVKTIDDMLAETGSTKPGDLTDALARRDRAIAAQQAALSQAEEAYRAAKAEEAAAADVWAGASAATATAQEQLRWVVDKNGSPTVLRAAQADLDAALVAQETADVGRKTCAQTLTAASRAMARAKRDLDSLFEETTGSGTLLRLARGEPKAEPPLAAAIQPEPKVDPPAEAPAQEPPVVQTREAPAPPDAPAHAPVAPAAAPPPSAAPQATPSYTLEFDEKSRRRSGLVAAISFAAACLLWIMGIAAPAGSQGAFGALGFLAVAVTSWSFTRILTYTQRNNLDGTLKRKNPSDPLVTGVLIVVCLFGAFVCLVTR